MEDKLLLKYQEAQSKKRGFLMKPLEELRKSFSDKEIDNYCQKIIDNYEVVQKSEDERKLILNDALKPHYGYCNLRTWNGWTCPYFSKNVADSIMNEVNSLDPVLKLEYDKENDRYICHDENYPDEPTYYEATKLLCADGKTRKVYPIGNGEWCWYN